MERDHLEYLDLDEMMLLSVYYIKGTGMNWINLAEPRVKGQ
jgi:hypothetical protein